MPPPPLDQNLCFLQCIEDFPVQKLVPELGVEALTVALPREIDHKTDACLDLSGLSEHKLQLVEELLSDVEMDEGQAVIEHKLDDNDGSSAT